jgi:hypothetical protein
MDNEVTPTDSRALSTIHCPPDLMNSPRMFSSLLRLAAAGLIGALLSSAAFGQTAALKRYLYMSVPDGSQAALAEHAPGIIVFDIDNGHKFVRFIPVPQFTQGGGRGVTGSPLGLRGFAVCLATHSAYYSAENGLLGQFDLETDKVVWETHLPEGVDRTDVTHDGKKIYAPTGYWDVGRNAGMLIVDGQNGKVLKRVTLGSGPHNSFVTLDGQHLVVSGIDWIAMFKTSNDEKEMYLYGVGDGGMFPMTVDRRLTRAYVSRYSHVGVDIVDLKKGEKMATVQDGVPPVPRRTHGAALTPDETELWLSDQAGQRLLIYDNTVMPPKFKQEVKLSRGGHGWVLFSMDGRFAWTHTEEVFDTRTRKQVGTLRDENNNLVGGSKFFEVHFRGNKVVAVGNQFPLGRAGEKPSTSE